MAERRLRGGVGAVFLANQRENRGEVSVRELPPITITMYIHYEFSSREEYMNWLTKTYPDIEKDNKNIKRRELRVDESNDEFHSPKKSY